MSIPLAAILDIGSTIIDRVIPDPTAAGEAKLKLLELQQKGELAQMDFQTKVLEAETSLSHGQIETNKIEAASDQLFKSGWRPAVGWVSVSALAYQMVVRPLLEWAGTNLWGWHAPPSLEIETLMTLLFGILGLGAYRTFEKVNAR